MKLEVGKYYRTRDGRKVGPMIHNMPGTAFPFDDGSGTGWRESGICNPQGESPRDLITEWTDKPAGPVRTITRKEIVPGVYGSVTVFANQNSVIIEMDNRMVWCADNIQNLRAAIATLSEIADAMEENSK